ncbi:TPA: hypothetical protein ACHLCY_004180, partial [Escherichia coli]
LIYWGKNTTIERQTIDLPVVQAYSSTVVANSATGFSSLNTNADNRRYPILRYFCVRKTTLRPNYGGA